MKNSNNLFLFLLLILAISFSNITLFCQSPSSPVTTYDSIKVERSFFGNSFFKGDKEFTHDEIEDILDKDPKSKELMSSSDSKETWGYIFLGAGAVLTYVMLYEIQMSYNNYGVSPLTSTYNKRTGYGQNANATAFMGVAALAVGFDIAGALFLLDSKSTFYSAIKAYNKNSFASLERVKLNIGINRIGFIFQLN